MSLSTLPLAWKRPRLGANLFKEAKMARFETFTFRVDEEEKKMLADLATRLQRSQSDTMRLLIQEAFKALCLDNTVEVEESHASSTD